ncbi:MAG: hypothetical protein AAF851_21545 [Myxococcota bacterium]
MTQPFISTRCGLGEPFLGRSAESAAALLGWEPQGRVSGSASLAEQVRAYVHDRATRDKYVASADTYLKSKRPSLDKEYDVLLVGGGLHAALFLYTFRRHDPDSSVLVVEGTSSLCSTFYKLGDSLILNSPTFSKVGLNSNLVPGHFIQLSDFDELEDRPFPTAKHLYELTTMMLFHADADVLFDFAVQDVSKVGGRYSVSGKERSIHSRSVIIANGAGDARSDSFRRDKSSERIIAGDEFIADYHVGNLHPERIQNKAVAVVGAGDTANSVMERFLPLTYPHREYGLLTEAPFLPRVLFWVGQRAADMPQFYAGNKRRYCHSGGVIEYFWGGDSPFELSQETWSRTKLLVVRAPEKLVSIRHTSSGLDLRTSTERFDVDLLVDCTGRHNALSTELLRAPRDYLEGDIVLSGGHYDHQLERFDASPRLLESKRVACRLRNEDIYFIGSAGPLEELVDDDEAKDGSLRHQERQSSITNSKWSLEHTLPRTLAFARMHVEHLRGRTGGPG